MKVLITGVTGFVGSAVAKHGAHFKWQIEGQCRTLPSTKLTYSVHCLSIDSQTDWSSCLYEKEVVIHCAARVHQMDESPEIASKAYLEVNTHGTLNLARQAAQAGVKRFIFLSSIKVNGEQTEPGQPFTAEFPPIPLDPYGASKYHAEQGLREIAQETGMEVVIIRPPLVYGPEVKANFLSMIQWIDKGIPLPLGRIKNQRSMVFIDNLVSLITTAAEHPEAVNQTFLVSDNDDVSTTELLRLIASSLGKRSRLLPVPSHLLVMLLRMLGKGDIAEKLTANLQVDLQHTQRILNWQPPVALAHGIQSTVDYYQAQKSSHKEYGAHL
ncbi:UDP-glucose 4-epimerase family protein [Vibrio palustris]|uniref:UDP-glucose 4-epimerase n=1 Tax=Vibrio palustris TaxID=1918946 RepID=A0A1R4B3N9_9VIBR|nr:SDR family oxidoreductase [Vibrio palustris]SJL83529.1 UDP-glucose 4-epimerase [Vibrio palustris]